MVLCLGVHCIWFTFEVLFFLGFVCGAADAPCMLDFLRCSLRAGRGQTCACSFLVGYSAVVV